MSRKDREQLETRKQKEYDRIVQRNREAESNPSAYRDRVALLALSNPVSRKVIATTSRSTVTHELSKGPTEQVVGNLNKLHQTGTVSSNKMKDAIMKKAPGEMDKAIHNFKKAGKEITVDSLCAEAKSTPSFVQLCSDIGLSMGWFEELAKKRMEAAGL